MITRAPHKDVMSISIEQFSRIVFFFLLLLLLARTGRYIHYTLASSYEEKNCTVDQTGNLSKNKNYEISISVMVYKHVMNIHVNIFSKVKSSIVSY